jgi:hypothetical protein
METGALTLIVAELAKLPRGSNQYTKVDVVATTSKHEDKTMEDLANAAGLSQITIVKGKALLDHGEPNVIDMVRNGEVGVVNDANDPPALEPSRAGGPSPGAGAKTGLVARSPNPPARFSWKILVPGCPN